MAVMIYGACLFEKITLNGSSQVLFKLGQLRSYVNTVLFGFA